MNRRSALPSIVALLHCQKRRSPTSETLSLGGQAGANFHPHDANLSPCLFGSSRRPSRLGLGRGWRCEAGCSRGPPRRGPQSMVDCITAAVAAAPRPPFFGDWGASAGRAPKARRAPPASAGGHGHTAMDAGSALALPAFLHPPRSAPSPPPRTQRAHRFPPSPSSFLPPK